MKQVILGEIKVKGRVKFFNRDKGFGFITELEKKEDYFVHIRDLVDVEDGFLKLGQSVQFDSEDTPRGKSARKVVVLS